MENNLNDLPQPIPDVLGDLVETAKSVCGENLVSIVLYGSAAEGRLRTSSDVNLILIFKTFEISQIDKLSEKLRLAQSTIQLRSMLILENEISAIAETFAVKILDVTNRHKVLYGKDPFSQLDVSRSATLSRLKQMTMNLTLRLRERYAMMKSNEDRLINVIADVSAPLRSCAFTILKLEGQSIGHPKEALQVWSKKFPNKNFEETLKNMSMAREELKLPHDKILPTVLGQLDLLQTMSNHIQDLH